MRDKYLSRWAEPEVAAAARIGGRWDAALVVPACAEDPSLLDGIAAVCTAADALLVVVVNGSEAHADSVHALNRALWAELARGGVEVAPGIVVGAGSPDRVLVDRASPGRRFSARDGVGLARKIGADLVLALGERVRSRWIHTTDADASLPPDYFRALPEAGVAIVRRFEHVSGGDEAVDDAHRRYELWLRYYVLGLGHARSPYALHTVGSTLGVDADAYAAVRGVPRRRAGEDFYLVAKLAKLGVVHARVGAPVRIRARTSARVPFGTGPAVRRLLAEPEGPHVYAPRIFEALRAWLRVIEHAAEHDAWDESALAVLDAPLRDALEGGLQRLGVRDALRDLHARHRGRSRRRHLHGWFDGFRTLKLVRALRDADLPDRPWREAFAEAPFLDGIDAAADVEHVRRGLIACEELAPGCSVG